MKIGEDNFIEELIGGNEKALEYVIDNYSYILKTVINRHLFYLEDRKEECMSDCLLAIWENIESYDPKRALFSNWIGGIAKYKSLDYLRKYLDDREIENIEDKIIIEDEDSLDPVLEKEFNMQMEDLLSHLSEEDQIIFKETYYKGRTAREISNEIDLSESVIYNRLSRGRQKLKELVGGRQNG